MTPSVDAAAESGPKAFGGSGPGAFGGAGRQLRIDFGQLFQNRGLVQLVAVLQQPGDLVTEPSTEGSKQGLFLITNLHESHE